MWLSNESLTFRSVVWLRTGSPAELIGRRTWITNARNSCSGGIEGGRAYGGKIPLGDVDLLRHLRSVEARLKLRLRAALC